MDHPVPETNLHSITSNYGFMMLFILIISYFLWKYFRSLYRNSSSSNNDTHRIAMEAARAKLQAEFNAEVAQYKSRKQEEMEGGKSNVSRNSFTFHKYSSFDFDLLITKPCAVSVTRFCRLRNVASELAKRLILFEQVHFSRR
ncbi:hypothetical protein EWB00_004894 [Schistosoma japonicum]|uniref:Selenoprotein S n=1 Tax=Schistosoma japonicum TaxID=6182 RepID=A0A4Z2D3J8_SCHJA|nr:hypothetical protein KSF78_0000160 [Schistosoma japonicum]TNN11074.1 hypothetical protein EWB00_004894 [Schistosoma japonicum]